MNHDINGQFNSNNYTGQYHRKYTEVFLFSWGGLLSDFAQLFVLKCKISIFFSRYLLSLGASVEAENENGEKPADLIDPDCKDLLKLFETGCVW